MGVGDVGCHPPIEVLPIPDLARGYDTILFSYRARSKEQHVSKPADGRRRARYTGPFTPDRPMDRGRIMQSLPLVRDYMAKRVRTLSPDTDIYKAVEVLLKNRISGAPVIDSDRHIVGIISEKDCLKLLAHGVHADLPKGPVAEYMTTDVYSISPEMDVYYVAGLFLKNHYRRFPVVDDDGRLIGQVSRRDVLSAVLRVAR